MILVAACMGVQIPNSSLYPEIDFASKCIESNTINQSSRINQLLFPLGNANSSDIQEQFEQVRLFVGAGEGGREDIQHITVAVDTRLENLVKKRMYN